MKTYTVYTMHPTNIYLEPSTVACEEARVHENGDLLFFQDGKLLKSFNRNYWVRFEVYYE